MQLRRLHIQHNKPQPAQHYARMNINKQAIDKLSKRGQNQTGNTSSTVWEMKNVLDRAPLGTPYRTQLPQNNWQTSWQLAQDKPMTHKRMQKTTAI